jgi:hypothetical protein
VGFLSSFGNIKMVANHVPPTLHSQSALTNSTLQWIRVMFPLRYELKSWVLFWWASRFKVTQSNRRDLLTHFPCVYTLKHMNEFVDCVSVGKCRHVGMITKVVCPESIFLYRGQALQALSADVSMPRLKYWVLHDSCMWSGRDGKGGGVLVPFSSQNN